MKSFAFEILDKRNFNWEMKRNEKKNRNTTRKKLDLLAYADELNIVACSHKSASVWGFVVC